MLSTLNACGFGKTIESRNGISLYFLFAYRLQELIFTLWFGWAQSCAVET